MKNDTLDISLDLLKILLEKALEKVFEQLLASKSNSQNNGISTAHIPKGITLFKPAFSLKEQREKHTKQLSDMYQTNNRGKHRLGDKFPKKINPESANTYENYKEINATLNKLHEDKKERYALLKK